MAGFLFLIPACAVIGGIAEATAGPDPIDMRRVDVIIEQMQIAQVMSSLLPVRIVEYARARGVDALTADSATALLENAAQSPSPSYRAKTVLDVRVEQNGWHVRRAGDSYVETFRVDTSIHSPC